MEYFYSFDIGGTFIKSALICDNKIIYKQKNDTQKSLEQKELADVLFDIIDDIKNKTKIDVNNCKGLVIGTTGLVDIENGKIAYSGALNVKNYELLTKLRKKINIPIKIQNDATIAALAEQKLGNKKNYKSFLFLTVGTGIGGDIVLNDNVYGITHSYSFEIGHIKIGHNLKCNCGKTGCYETLASTGALVKQTANALKSNPDSLMWQTYTPETVTGKTVFEYKDKDETAKQVFDNYIKNLGNGIISVINILPVDAVYIGGAISAQGENLLRPLSEYVNSNTHISNIDKKIPILQATNINDAGVLGGIFLF